MVLDFWCCLHFRISLLAFGVACISGVARICGAARFSGVPGICRDHFYLCTRWHHAECDLVAWQSEVEARPSSDEMFQALQTYKNFNILVVSTENITQNWYFGNQRSMLIPNCLFRVGGAAIVLTNRQKYALQAKYASALPCFVRFFYACIG